MHMFLFDYLISFFTFFTCQSTILHLCWDRSSRVKPVLCKDIMCIGQGQSTVTPLRLKPTALGPLVKHSTTEPLCCLIHVYYCTLDKVVLIYFNFNKANFLHLHDTIVYQLPLKFYKLPDNMVYHTACALIRS